MDLEDVAPSEEFSLLCDVPDCDASVSMVAGVDRAKHGWGRMSLYHGLGNTTDYDLCAFHHARVKEVLAG